MCIIYRVRGICVTNFQYYETSTYNQGKDMKIIGHVNLGLKNTLPKKNSFCLMAISWWGGTVTLKTSEKHDIGSETANKWGKNHTISLTLKLILKIDPESKKNCGHVY